jgi:trehalose 6-phosphate phosphatase
MKHCLTALSDFAEALRNGGRVLIATDFDVTLCPIAADPSKASLAPAMLDILRLVQRCEGVTLAVISGRSLPDVRRCLSLDLIFAGNHGLEIACRGFRFHIPMPEDFAPSYQRRGGRLRACGVTGRVHGSKIRNSHLPCTTEMSMNPGGVR